MGSFPSTRNPIVVRRSTLACRSMREVIPCVRLGKRREESLFLPRTPFVVQCSQPLPDISNNVGPIKSFLNRPLRSLRSVVLVQRCTEPLPCHGQQFRLAHQRLLFCARANVARIERGSTHRV